jgi:hypothetical protein
MQVSEWMFATNTGSDLGRRADELGCIKSGNLNCSDDDPERDKQSAEEQEPSDDSLDSALPSGRPVGPRHELTSGRVCSKNAMGKCLVN